MLTLQKQKQFAELAVRIGVNMQKGQEVVIDSDVACQDFARLIAEQAYAHGAKLVTMLWSDEKISRLSYDYASTETLCDVPQYIIQRNKYFIEHNCCLIKIAAGNPNIFKGVAQDKLGKVSAARSTALKEFHDATMSNLLRWCIVSVPTASWAKTVFPTLSEQKAIDKLWDAIGKTMRLDSDNPTAAWQQHLATLSARAQRLNELNFDKLHLYASNGTDITVGLARNHTWLAAQEEGADGVPFTANMPTEEVFTAPHCRDINGTVHNALPLVYNGTVIDGFCLTFKDGKVVDFEAKEGYETLKKLLDTDEGSRSLGEIALLGKNSPIAQSGILFYNTLFDENASCHLALGASYPTTFKDGNSLTQQQRNELGGNYSIKHVDFMVGTKDLNIDGIDAKGNKTPVFRQGEWVL